MKREGETRRVKHRSKGPLIVGEGMVLRARRRRPAPVVRKDGPRRSEGAERTGALTHGKPWCFGQRGAQRGGAMANGRERRGPIGSGLEGVHFVLGKWWPVMDTRKRRPNGTFEPGGKLPENARRAKGVANKITSDIRQGAISGFARHGSNGRGEGGFSGFCYYLATSENGDADCRKAFAFAGFWHRPGRQLDLTNQHHERAGRQSLEPRGRRAPGPAGTDDRERGSQPALLEHEPPSTDLAPELTPSSPKSLSALREKLEGLSRAQLMKLAGISETDNDEG